MKSIMMLMAGTAAVLALNTSGALSQDACSKGYLTCMNMCIERPTKDSQEPCLQSCQVKNNRCSEEIYGSRKEVVPKSTVTTPDTKKPDGKEAVSPPPRKVDIAPRAEAPHLRTVDVPLRRKSEAPAEKAEAIEAKK